MHGIAEVAFRGGPGGTRLAGLYQRAPLRVLFPTPPEPGLATAVLVTTSGGLVGGDRLEARIEVRRGGGGAGHQPGRREGLPLARRRLPGGRRSWWPGREAGWNGCRRRPSCSTAPASTGGRGSTGAPVRRVLAGEMLVFGREAYGERLRRGAVRDAWEIRCNGGWSGPMRWRWRAISPRCWPRPPASPAPPRWRRSSMPPTADAGAALDLARDLTRGLPLAEMAVG